MIVGLDVHLWQLFTVALSLWLGIPFIVRLNSTRLDSSPSPTLNWPKKMRKLAISFSSSFTAINEMRNLDKAHVS